MRSRSLVGVLLAVASVQSATAAPQIDDRRLARITAWGDRTESGSGFRAPSGDIVTAYHVILGARRIDVRIGGAAYTDVEVVAVRPEADVAILRLPSGQDGSFYPIASALPAAGSPVYVHGSPLGFERQILVGRLTQSGLMRSQEWFDRQKQPIFVVRNLELIPVDITAEPGLSGGPLIGEDGSVLGVFSGSLQAGGRGYAWAVPIRYVAFDEMRSLGKPASAISSWPPFNYLRPGLSLLRSLHSDTVASGITRSCRMSVEEYRKSWLAGVDAETHLSLLLNTLVRPMLDEITDPANEATLETKVDQLAGLVDLIRDPLGATGQTSEKLMAATSQVISFCYSNVRLTSLIPEGTPPTRRNLLADAKWARRMNEARQFVHQFDTEIGLLTRRGRQIQVNLLDFTIDPKKQSLQQQFERYVRYFRGIAEATTNFLSLEQAKLMDLAFRQGSLWAEILEGIESEDWEQALQSYDYQDPSGITVTLRNGWMNLDASLRSAIFDESKDASNDIPLIKLANLNPGRIQARAKLDWDVSNSNSMMEGPVRVATQWRIADSIWDGLKAQESAWSFDSERRAERRLGSDLVLEHEATARHADGREFRWYYAQRLGASGVATVVCVIRDPALPSESCAELTNSLRAPAEHPDNSQETLQF